MPLLTRQSGVWKPSTGFLARDAGLWKPAVGGFARDAGVWKPFIETGISFSLVGVKEGKDTSIEISGGTTSDRSAGDVAIIWNTGRTDGTAPTQVTPSGFTSLRSGRALQVTTNVSVKILNGSETSVSGINGSSWETWMLAVFRPSEPVASWTDHDTGNNETTTGDPTAQTITVSTGTAPIIAYGHMSGRAAPNEQDPETVLYGDMDFAGTPTDLWGTGEKWAHYKIFNPGSALSDITYDLPGGGTTFVLQSGWLDFTPA